MAVDFASFLLRARRRDLVHSEYEFVPATPYTCHLVDIRIVVKRADICNLLGLLDAPVKLFLFFIAPFMGKGLEMAPIGFDLSRTGFVQRSLRQPSACCNSRVFYETAVLSTHKGPSIHSSDIYIFFSGSCIAYL